MSMQTSDVDALTKMAEKLYCLCRRPYEPTEFMIECEVCKDWFHGNCVGIKEHLASEIEIYHCPKCQQTNGPLHLKKRRNFHRHDYSELDDNFAKNVQTGTVSFMHELKHRTFPSADELPIVRLSGYELTPEWFEKNGFTVPILVDRKDGLDLKVPPATFTIQDVENYVGSMHEIDVIDVARQEDCKMLMREWTDYYNSPDRRKIFNVISLEFSKTRLVELVDPPRIVKELSWVSNYWPKVYTGFDEVSGKPEVHRYCLMGVKDSFTDFHIDFGGTSVWYHVLRGEKIFYIIKPTPANMSLYERWLSSSNQCEMFFGDQVDACYRCVIKQGQTIFLPTGWIHAVLTPVDSLVFGGNFLHNYNIELQLKVYDLERRVKTQEKYLFPCFETLHWYAAKNILETIRSFNSRGLELPTFLASGAKALALALRSWTSKKDEKHEAIPKSLQHINLSKELQKELKILTRMKEKEQIVFSSSSMNMLPSDVDHEETISKVRKKRSMSDYLLSDSFEEVPVKRKKKKNSDVKIESQKPIKPEPEFDSWLTKRSANVDSSYSSFSNFDFSTDEIESKFKQELTSTNMKAGPFGDISDLFNYSSFTLPSDTPSNNSVLKLRMSGGKVISGCSTEVAEPGKFQLLGRSSSNAAEMDSDNDEQLIVDEAPRKYKSNHLTTTIKPASLKLKLSMNRPDSELGLPDSTPADYANRLKMPLIRGGLNSSISDILEVSGYGTETDIKVDEDIGRASPTMRDAIQGMLSMSQMGRLPYSSSSTLLSSSKSSKKSSAYFDDLDLQMKTCYKDNDFVYPTLDISDNEDDAHLRNKSNSDELWNPKAKVVPNCPKPVRPQRQGARKESVESGLAAAAAKLGNIPIPKRHYNKKKVKVDKKSASNINKVVVAVGSSLAFGSTGSIFASEASASGLASGANGSSLGSGAGSSGLASDAGASSVVASTSSVLDHFSESSTSAVKLPPSSPTKSDLKVKKPKKGMATAKQRLAQKLKMHKMF